MAVYEREPPAEFWSCARAELEGLPGGGLNIAHEAVDRHAAATAPASPPCAASPVTAAAWISPMRELAALTNRFANALSSAGLERGDVSARSLGRLPDAVRRGAGDAQARAACTARCFRRSVPSRSDALGDREARVARHHSSHLRAQVRAGCDRRCPTSSTSFIGNPDQPSGVQGTLDWHVLMADASDVRPAIRTDAPEDLALLHFTSGTTGTPKGAVHVHEAVVAHHDHRPAGARSASRRRLLVHRRPGLGDRHLLWHHRPAHERRDQHRR